MREKVKFPSIPAVPPSPEAPRSGLSLLRSPVGGGQAGRRGELVLLRLQLPGPPRLSQAGGSQGVAAFPGQPGQAQAGPTFLTRWVRLGLAQPGVGAPPARQPAPASSAPWPCKELVWQPPGRMWELLALQVLVGWGAGWGQGLPAGAPRPTMAWAVGHPCSSPLHAPCLCTPLCLCTWKA